MAYNQHIYIFRCKLIKNKQLPLEFESYTPEQIFKSALSEKPSIEMREGYTWHIGNIHYETETIGHFKIGRKEISALPKYDDESKDFIDELSENSPNTVIYFDTNLGLLGVVKKYELSPTEFGIADKIEKLLQSTNIVNDTMTTVEIDSLKNPIEFISRIKNAYCIKKYTVTFGGPNPFDADEHFHKPMSIYLNEANGKEGKTIIDGDDLNSEVIVRMTRSIASTGNDATARIQDKQYEKVVTVYLKNNPAKVIVPQTELSDSLIVGKMIEAYNGVRNNENN
jgi:hypothetical protein